MAYRISGCGLGTVYAHTKEEADEEYRAMGLCSYGAYPEVTEFTPRYWAVQTQKDGDGDEHWIGLVGEKDKDALIRLADRSYTALTKEEKKKYDITVFLVHEDFLVIFDCWDTVYCNGVDYTKPYVDEHAKVGQNGNSLTVVITEAARHLDIDKGDEVIITIQKKLRE